MANITTTSDYLTWYVNLDLHTEDEAKTYFQSLDYDNPDDLRCLSIQNVDKVIVVNGIGFIPSAFQNALPRFTAAMGEYTTINHNRVKAIHYFPDRDYVMVEYLSHPADVRPSNTEHTSAEFGEFFRTVFEAWKTGMTDVYAGTLLPIEVEAPVTAVATGG